MKFKEIVEVVSDAKKLIPKFTELCLHINNYRDPLGITVYETTSSVERDFTFLGKRWRLKLSFIEKEGDGLCGIIDLVRVSFDGHPRETLNSIWYDSYGNFHLGAAQANLKDEMQIEQAIAYLLVPILPPREVGGLIVPVST